MPSHRHLTPVLALALVATVGACGKDQTLERRLGDDTFDVVQALNAKDVTAARKALDVLDADLTAAGRLDQLDDARVTELRAGVSKLRADLALLAPKVTPTPTPVRTTVVVTPRDGGGKRHGKGEGKDD